MSKGLAIAGAAALGYVAVAGLPRARAGGVPREHIQGGFREGLFALRTLAGGVPRTRVGTRLESPTGVLVDKAGVGIDFIRELEVQKLSYGEAFGYWPSPITGKKTPKTSLAVTQAIVDAWRRAWRAGWDKNRKNFTLTTLGESSIGLIAGAFQNCDLTVAGYDDTGCNPSSGELTDLGKAMKGMRRAVVYQPGAFGDWDASNADKAWRALELFAQRMDNRGLRPRDAEEEAYDELGQTLSDPGSYLGVVGDVVGGVGSLVGNALAGVVMSDLGALALLGGAVYLVYGRGT